MIKSPYCRYWNQKCVRTTVTLFSSHKKSEKLKKNVPPYSSTWKMYLGWKFCSDLVTLLLLNVSRDLE